MTLVVKALPGPTINFVESDIELEEGYESLSVSTNVDTANESIGITSIELYLNDGFVREVYEAPFTWGTAEYADELLGLTQGEHMLKAVVTDSNGKTGETEMLIMVNGAPMLGDLDKDGDVDRDDVRAFSLAVRTGGVSNMEYDFNNDGVLSSRDVRGLSLLCTRSRCATE